MYARPVVKPMHSVTSSPFLSLVPRSHLEEGKGVWWIWMVSLIWPAQWAWPTCLHYTTNLGSDWSVMLHVRSWDSNSYSRQWRFAFLWLVSHMTVSKLQSHWNPQIPFPGPRIVSKFTRPLFPPWGWDLRTSLDLAKKQQMSDTYSLLNYIVVINVVSVLEWSFVQVVAGEEAQDRHILVHQSFACSIQRAEVLPLGEGNLPRVCILWHKAPCTVCNSKNHTVYVCTAQLQVLETLYGFYTAGAPVHLQLSPKATTRTPQMNTLLSMLVTVTM